MTKDPRSRTLLQRTRKRKEANPAYCTAVPHLEHEVEGEGLGEGVLQGRLGVVLVENFTQLVGAVGIRLPLDAEVILALRLTTRHTPYTHDTVHTLYIIRQSTSNSNLGYT